MGVHSTARSSYVRLKRGMSNNPIRDWIWFLEQEVNTWNNWVQLPFRRRLWLWRHGFPSPVGKLYDFDSYGAEAYLSEIQRYKLYRALNGRHRYLLDDKLSQHWMLNDYPDNRPTTYGFLDSGYAHGVADTTFDGDSTPVGEWIPDLLQRESPLVCKQLRGKAGKEVIVCEYDDGYRIDGEPVSEEGLVDELTDLSGYLVSEFVSQHDYADDLYPKSPNTIRVLTLWDSESESLHTLMAVQRIGTDQSQPVDNCSAGGLTAEIDVEVGEIGPAAQFPFSGDVSWYRSHPDTGARIDGVDVPEWNEVLSIVERLAKDNTHIPIIGWDVLIDESGEPVVIEANTGSGLTLLQVHKPLLTDPRFAEIAARHLPNVSEPT